MSKNKKWDEEEFLSKLGYSLDISQPYWSVIDIANKAYLAGVDRGKAEQAVRVKELEGTIKLFCACTPSIECAYHREHRRIEEAGS